jgi:G3E family GTPase
MTPLVLITGFLGAGKTTFLRRVLPLLIEAGARPRVILNDYANADLDSATLRDLVPDITPITGSCVCCNSMDDLLGTLMDLQLGERDVVFVEANGTTDPLPLLEVFLLTSLRRRFPCLLQIALIDAKRWQRRGTNDELERMQARTASHLRFTWMDAAAKGRQLNVRTEVKRLNPRAEEVNAKSFAARLAALTSMPDDAAAPAFVAWPKPTAASPLPFKLSPLTGGRTPIRNDTEPSIFSSPLFQSRRSVKHALAHRFRAIQLEVPRGLRPLQLVAWLESLPAAVIRAKGIVEFGDQPGRFHYFQRVEDTVSFSDMAVQPPDNLTLALLIGVGLDEPSLRTSANQLLATGHKPLSNAPREASGKGGHD